MAVAQPEMFHRFRESIENAFENMWLIFITAWHSTCYTRNCKKVFVPCHYLNSHEVLTMGHAHEEKGVEVIGVVPSIAMVLGGLAVAILPALVQVFLVFAG